MFSMVFSKSAPVKQSLIFRTFGYLVKPTEFGPSLLILKRDGNSFLLHFFSIGFIMIVIREFFSRLNKGVIV